jgi:hypothetical protein
LSQPAPRLTTTRHSPGRTHPRALGRRAGPGPCRLRDALDAQDQGDADLPAHQEPACCAAAPRARQAGVDGVRHRAGLTVSARSKSWQPTALWHCKLPLGASPRRTARVCSRKPCLTTGRRLTVTHLRPCACSDPSAVSSRRTRRPGS